MAIRVAKSKYARSLETLSRTAETHGTRESAVRCRFVALTSEKLAEWMARPLGDVDLWAVFIDGVHFGEHVILCALNRRARREARPRRLGGRDRERDRLHGDAQNLPARGLNRTARGCSSRRQQGLRAAIRSVYSKKTLVQRCLAATITNGSQSRLSGERLAALERKPESQP